MPLADVRCFARVLSTGVFHCVHTYVLTLQNVHTLSMCRSWNVYSFDFFFCFTYLTYYNPFSTELRPLILLYPYTKCLQYDTYLLSWPADTRIMCSMDLSLAVTVYWYIGQYIGILTCWVVFGPMHSYIGLFIGISTCLLVYWPVYWYIGLLTGMHPCLLVCRALYW